MEVAERILSLRMTGKDVAKAQRDLAKLGFKIPGKDEKLTIVMDTIFKDALSASTNS